MWLLWFYGCVLACCYAVARAMKELSIFFSQWDVFLCVLVLLSVNPSDLNYPVCLTYQ